MNNNRVHLAVLAGVIVAQLTAGLMAVGQDGYGAASDELQYYMQAVMAGKALREEPSTFLAAFFSEPERAHLSTLPASLLLSISGEASLQRARASSLLWLALLLWSTFSMGRRLLSPAAGLVAAAVAGSMPLVMGFSRVLWPDLPLAAWTALSVDLLLATRLFSRRQAGLWFGLVLGLGSLVKTAYGLHMSVPLAVTLVLMLRRPEGRRRAVLNAAISLGLAGVITVGLFAQRVEHILHEALRARPDAEQALLLADPDQLGSARHLFYLEWIPRSATGPLLGALFLVGLAAALFRRQGQRVAVPMSWLAGSLVGLSFFVPWLRYALPALPAMALVVGVGLFSLPALARRRGAAPLLAVVLTLLGLLTSGHGMPLSACPPNKLEDSAAGARVMCNGALIPGPATAQRLSFAGLHGRNHEIRLGILSYTSEGQNAPNLMLADMLQVSLAQWMITDMQQPVRQEIIDQAGLEGGQWMDRFDLIVLVLSPPDYHSDHPWWPSYRAAREQLITSPGRWRKVRGQDFPSGIRLVLYRNSRRVVQDP